MKKSDFGILGLGVMGQSLALNALNNGYRISVWNYTADAVDHFVQDRAKDLKVRGETEIGDLVESLEPPRKMMMMITAGDPVDSTLQRLLPHLQEGDIVIDGGNSHYEDTIRREKHLRSQGIHFLGTGVSGGEKGALEGPSIMPGGPEEGYQRVAPILEKLAARTEDGPCVGYIGPDGAGHFVKTVHNGIEYGLMQLLAESYDILSRLLGYDASNIAQIFSKWNDGDLESFLVEISAQIFTVEDEATGRPLVELILDSAGQKGTGRWASHAALEVAVATPTIHAAIEARFLSSIKDERRAASNLLEGPDSGLSGDMGAEQLVDWLQDAVYSSFVACYGQGMSLIQETSEDRKWGISLAEVCRIWKDGCIIRSRLLDSMKAAFLKAPELPNLMLDPTFAKNLKTRHHGWRKICCAALKAGIAIPALVASLGYYDLYRRQRLPLNLVQAQRDFFGAHGYQRVDRASDRNFHTDWLEEVKPPW